MFLLAESPATRARAASSEPTSQMDGGFGDSSRSARIEQLESDYASARIEGRDELLAHRLCSRPARRTIERATAAHDPEPAPVTSLAIRDRARTSHSDRRAGRRSICSKEPTANRFR